MKKFLGLGRSRQKKAQNLMIADEAGSSSARPAIRRKSPIGDFEVFLNFRGPDSRSTIVSVLYDALDRAGIRVFYDDESIRHGAVIEGELKEAITNSKIYIPIFSRDYASSRWCLRELDMILECWEASQRLEEQEEEEKTILPIFHDVDVSTDLKLKSELYTNALKKHRRVLGEDVVRPWEDALRTAATIKGRDIRNHGLSGLTKLIVEEVCCKLWTRSDPEKVLYHYVGIDYPMEDIMKILDLNTYDVRFLTIYGMGGVGKTTLARLVFNRISHDFERCVAFLSNIRERSRTDAGIVDLQKDLISQLLQVNSSLSLQHTDHGIQMVKDRLKYKKVLIVLDDLDKSDQRLKLAGGHSWFGMGSRIIITTRNLGIVPKGKGFHSYKMHELRPNDALKLFSRLVFESNLPPKEYSEFSKAVVETTGRLPLAIGVIAPLFRNNSLDAWEGTLEKLNNLVHKDVREKLLISYEQLDNCEKEIFLDVACLFINKEIEDATYYWEARGLYPKSGIMVLKNMSLIEIVDGNKLGMHGLLRDLGRNLVDEETDIHERRSRSWSPMVALNVVRSKKGTEKVVALKLGKPDGDCTFNFIRFAGLINLKFLELNGGNYITEDFEDVFLGLIWLSWDNYPVGFQLPSSWLYNVVVLTLSKNLIADDWDGWYAIGGAPNLKVLKCTHCGFMMKSPEFNKIKLERLVFKNCAMLREISPSVCNLERLIYLEITNPLIYMERLNNECLEEGGPEILPINIGMTKSLLVLKLKFVNLSKLPGSIGELVNLRCLCLWCPKLKELPESVGDLMSLVELDISFTAIIHLPKSVIHLESLNVFKYEDSQLDENYAYWIEEEISSRLFSSISIERLIPSRLFDPIGTEGIESLRELSSVGL